MEKELYAFPNPHFGGMHGMTLRDYFAAKAMPISVNHYADGHIDGWYGIAKHAYVIADAMMKARGE